MPLIEAPGIDVVLIDADAHLERAALPHLLARLSQQPGADAAVAALRLHVELLQLCDRAITVWGGTQRQEGEAHCTRVLTAAVLGQEDQDVLTLQHHLEPAGELLRRGSRRVELGVEVEQQPSDARRIGRVCHAHTDVLIAFERIGWR